MINIGLNYEFSHTSVVQPQIIKNYCLQIFILRTFQAIKGTCEFYNFIK